MTDTLGNEVMVNVGRVDWDMLRVQKLALLTIIPKQKKAVKEALDGIVHFIDDIQDQASEQIGEPEVFGRHEGEVEGG